MRQACPRARPTLHGPLPGVLVAHPIHARCSQHRPIGLRCGAVAEWSKALAWKVSIRQNRIEGSNPSRSAICSIFKIQRVHGRDDSAGMAGGGAVA